MTNLQKEDLTDLVNKCAAATLPGSDLRENVLFHLVEDMLHYNDKQMMIVNILDIVDEAYQQYCVYQDMVNQCDE